MIKKKNKIIQNIEVRKQTIKFRFLTHSHWEIFSRVERDSKKGKLKSNLKLNP